VGGSGVAALADLVLPRVCAGCGLPGRVLCRRCAGLLARPRLATPRRVPWGFPPTVAAGAYEAAVRPVVIAFKERGRAELARPLGTALALAVVALRRAVPEQRGPVLLVPVPSARAALRARGRDHVRELTRQALTELRLAGVPAAEARLLRRHGRVRDSAGLSAAQRRANLAGTFALHPHRPAPGPGTLLVLVDDVVTSGATLTEAARALSAALPPGSLPVLAAVVAATPRTASAADVRARPAGRPGRNGIERRHPLDRLSGERLRD
jgi:predicted amidophosphoribosyltransferase